jgi:hypothetical protein
MEGARRRRQPSHQRTGAAYRAWARALNQVNSERWADDVEPDDVEPAPEPSAPQPRSSA